MDITKRTSRRQVTVLRRASCVLLLLLLVPGLSGAARAAAPGLDEVQAFIDRTGELIDWAIELVHDTDSQQARHVLDQARDLHARSLDLLHDNRLRLALAASRRARSAAQRAAQLARVSRGSEELARLRLERYQEFRDQVRDRVRDANDERALRFVRESEKQAERAQEQYQQRNFGLALNLLKPAEDLLGRAARLLFEGNGAARLDSEIERTQMLIDRTAERLADGGSGAAGDDLLESAREALGQAHEFRDRGQPLRTLQSLRLARRLTTQAAATASEDISRESVVALVERWDEQQGDVSERVRDGGSDAAAQAMARARDHREHASRLLEQGDLEAALRQIRAAFDLLNEADDLTR